MSGSNENKEGVKEMVKIIAKPRGEDDASGLGGLWDLSGELAREIYILSRRRNVQDVIYEFLSKYVEDNKNAND
jgi:hypothetical protein